MSRQRSRRLFGVLEERVLGQMLLRPDRAWYRSELARELGVSPSSLQRILARLTVSGVLKAREDGNRLYYQADTSNPLFPELRSLLLKTSGLVAVLRAALDEYVAQIDVAFVYGSVASGDETSTSDIDFIIIGSIRRSQVAQALHVAEKSLGRELNATFFPPEEWAAKLAAMDRFTQAVLGRPKLLVVGTEDDLGRSTHPEAGGT